MKVLLTTTIVLGLSFGACFTPPKKAQSPYPETISLQEVIDINQAFLLDDAYTNISGDYFIEGDVNFDFGDDSFTGGLTASIPFAIGTDGFEVTVRSQDMSFVGDLEEFLPEFKARITASDNSGLHIRGFAPDLGVQRAFVNPEVYHQLKEVMVEASLENSDINATLEPLMSLVSPNDPESLGLLMMNEWFSSTNVYFDHEKDGVISYSTKLSTEFPQAMHKVTADFGIENSTQILGDFIGDHDLAAQIISLSDEQLTNILDAISELIEFEFEYRFITTNSGELMMIGGNFLFDLPSIETINSKLDSIIDTVNHELKLTNPSGSSTLSHLPPIEDDGFFPELRLMLRVAVNNIDLSEIPAGHFDFEQPDNAIDYSDMIGPQIPMMRQAIKDANSYIDIQAGDDSEVF